MSERQTESMPDDAAPPRLSVGANLRAAREALGLSTQEIAGRVKFSMRQVEALESDDAANLPQGTFLRGFIRSYARMVNLDPDVLLSETETHTEHHFKVTDVQGGGEPLPTAGDAARKNRFLLLGALVVILGLVLFLLNKPNIPDIPITSVPTPSAEISAVEAAAAVTGKIGSSAGEPPPAALPQNPAASPKAAVPVSQEDVLATAKPGLSIPLEQLMKRPIHIVYTDQAWVEIKDVNGEVLISRVTDAGGEKWIGGSGREPYQVVLGRAGAVRLYYKGSEVDLSGFKPDSVARLVLE